MMLLLLLWITLTESVHTQQSEFKGPPENITLIWQDDVMVIQTSDVQYVREMSRDCFILVLQRKSGKEMEWQKSIKSSECYTMDFSLMYCNFLNANLDPEKCFHIQLQFQTDRTCTHEIHKSEWSNNIYMKNHSLVESCDAPTVGTQQDSPPFIILFSAVSTLIIFVIVLLRCNMERMKNCVFPIVPDPKNSFHNLFDSHNGYFQEWLKTAPNGTHQEVVECIMDEQNDEPVSTSVKESEVVMPIHQPVIEEQEDNVTPASLQEEASNVCFGNMNFTMNESMYVML